MLKKIFAKTLDISFILFWGIVYYLLFRYFILKIFWFGSLPMDYWVFDIHLLLAWMLCFVIGCGFWLKKNAAEFFQASLEDKIGLLILSLIWLVIFFLGLGVIYLISSWLGEYSETITFWHEWWYHLKYRPEHI